MAETIRSLRYPFTLDTGLSEFAQELSHDEHVKQMIKQVLFTSQGERVNRIDFGCGIRRMLFAPASEATASLAQVTVLEALEKWLSSVIKVDRVDVKFDNERLDIAIVYALKTTGEQRYLNVEVTP